MNAILLIGPPGAGKTMLARQIHAGLRAPTELEQARIVGAYYDSNLEPPNGRPFRAPHHTASYAAMFGGKHGAKRLFAPGEFQLATDGVILMDELPEFSGTVILESARLHRNIPAVLIGAMTACPCGMLGNPDRNCDCKTSQIERYQNRIKPFLEWCNPVTLWVDVQPSGIAGAEYMQGRFIVHSG